MLTKSEKENKNKKKKNIAKIKNKEKTESKPEAVNNSTTTKLTEVIPSGQSLKLVNLRFEGVAFLKCHSVNIR